MKAERRPEQRVVASMRTIPILCLALAGCAADPEAQSARAEAELAEELEGRTAGEPQDCVPIRGGRSLAVRDRQTLVYEDFGTLWVNRLEAPCPGLDPFSRLIVDVHGSRYCRGDRIRGLEAGASVAGPWCPLGRFTPWRRP